MYFFNMNNVYCILNSQARTKNPGYLNFQFSLYESDNYCIAYKYYRVLITIFIFHIINMRKLKFRVTNTVQRIETCSFN